MSKVIMEINVPCDCGSCPFVDDYRMEESSFYCNHPYGNQEDVNIYMTEFRPEHCPFNRTKPVTIKDGTAEKEIDYVVRDTPADGLSCD